MSLFAASEAKSFDALGSIAGESFFKWMVSTSMVPGSLVEHGLEGNEERGKSCPFLRAMI